MYGSGFDSLCIGSERNPQNHRQMKSSLSAAFSTKVLQEQESIVAQVVDSFIAKVEAHCGGFEAMNMTKWYEMVAFDVLGEMAFGQSFRSIESGQFCLSLSLSLPGRFIYAEGDRLLPLLNDREAAFLVRTHRRASLLYYGRGQPSTLMVRTHGGETRCSVYENDSKQTHKLYERHHESVPKPFLSTNSRLCRLMIHIVDSRAGVAAKISLPI